jgi:hypothetical protein
MATFIFKNEKLRSILKISEQATEFRATFEEAYKAYEVKTGRKYKDGIDLNPFYKLTTPTLWLVRDTGVYLMTSAFLDPIPEDNIHQCFAESFAPTDPDWFDKSAMALGTQEDFVESFEFTDALKKGIRLGADIHIHITKTEYSVELIPI